MTFLRPPEGDRPTTLGRLGLGLGALAGLLLVLAVFLPLAEGPRRGMPAVTAHLDLGRWALAPGILGFALIGATVLLPAVWARLAGLVLATALAGLCATLAIVARNSDRFASHADVTLQAGGVLLVVAFALAMLGVALALVGFARPVPIGSGRDAAGRSGKPLAAFVLGLVGLFVPIAAPLAVAFGAIALNELRAGGFRAGGRGLAIAGLVLGIAILSLSTLGLALNLSSASPS